MNERNTRKLFEQINQLTELLEDLGRDNDYDGCDTLRKVLVQVQGACVYQAEEISATRQREFAPGKRNEERLQRAKKVRDEFLDYARQLLEEAFGNKENTR